MTYRGNCEVSQRSDQVLFVRDTVKFDFGSYYESRYISFEVEGKRRTRTSRDCNLRR